MPPPLEPFSKHDFNHLWKNKPPKLEVYILIRKLLERKVVQILKDASRRVQTPDKLIKVTHIKPSINEAKSLYFVNKNK